MLSSPQTEGKHPFEFLRSEDNGTRSRENITIDLSQTLNPGALLGQKTLGAATVTPGACVSGSGGTPGNGAMGVWTVDAGGQAGEYDIVFTLAAANAGHFEVFRPDKTLDGVGSVGVAYNGMINGTIADGSADFVAADRVPVVVSYAAGNLRYVAINPTATDGSQHCAGVLGYGVTTDAETTVQSVAIVRSAEVVTDRLDFGVLTVGAQQTQALADLAARGVIAR